MGNMLSTSSDEEVADGIAYPGRRDEEKYADIKLSCDSFMKFDGTLEKWFPFKEDVLAKAGSGGYAYFFEPGFILDLEIREYTSCLNWQPMEVRHQHSLMDTKQQRTGMPPGQHY
jgi:hypothetical protein